ERVLRDLDLDVEVTGRAAAGADLALTGELDPVAVVHPRGDVDLQGATRAHSALTGALAAGIGDDRAVAVADRAGPRGADVAEQRALDVLNVGVAVPVTGATGDRRGAGVRAGAAAQLAGDRGVDLDLAGDAERRLGEADRQAQQRVGAALGPRARTAGRALTEERVHDVVEAEAL